MTYVVPNSITLPLLSPEQIEYGWEYGAEVIDDNMPNQYYGHGTGVACLAGATSNKVGVAPQTNLFLIKWQNFYQRKVNGQYEKSPGYPQIGVWINAFTGIYNAWLPASQGGLGIPAHKSVINLSSGELADPGSESHILTYEDTGSQKSDQVLKVT